MHSFEAEIKFRFAPGAFLPAKSFLLHCRPTCARSTAWTFGLAPATIGVIIPIGYAFNSIGSMDYCAFAALFITQAYGVNLSPEKILLMLTILLFASKGIANVPRAALVVMVTVPPYFDVSEARIALILGVDQILDMGQTALNVLANAVSAACIARAPDPG